LLLRGLARSQRFWFDLRPRLARRFRVIAMDNRGIGRSGAARAPFTTRQMADDAAAVLDHAGLARAHVFGVSLGGMVAMRLALRHPARVDRLVLGCTTPGGRHATRVPLDAVLALLRAGRLPFADALERTAPYVLSEPFLRARPDVVRAWREVGALEPVPLRTSLFQLLAAAEHDVFASLPTLPHRTLVLTGDADRLIPAANSRLLAATIPGATLIVLPGAGHEFTAEQPEETTVALERFLLED
jgi:pimeloyl-ACP methyl ester carboxylesterase